MELLALRHFQAVARREHMSRAAEDLHIAQPALSRTIRRLESEVGVPLFDRQGRRVRLNRHGAAFLRRVDRALGELDDARRELADATSPHQGQIAVAAETLLPLTNLLSRYVGEYPDVDVRLYQAPVGSMAELLSTGVVDLGIASQPLPGQRLATIDVLDEEVLVAVAPEHRLAEHERTTMDEIVDEPVITTREGYWQRTLTDRLFADHGRRPRIVCEGDEPGATQFLISAGLGIGLLPTIARQAQAQAPVAWLHLDDPRCRRTLSLIGRTDAYISPAANRFREFVIDYYAVQTKPRPGNR